MEFVDPHFHYWDITPPSPSGHNPNIIKAPAAYLPTDYVEDMRATGFTLKKAVFVEALSDAPLEEVNWVTQQIASNDVAKDIPHKIVAYADLTQEPNVVEDLLKSYAQNPLVVGIRQILNHHPTNPLLTWPKVSRDYLHDPTWRENFSLLAKYNFTFDFQGNPHQLLTAAEIFKANPNIPIVIDHLGTLYLRGEDDKDEALKVWREGLREMANLPQIHMKLSMLGFVCTVKEEKYPDEVIERWRLGARDNGEASVAKLKIMTPLQIKDLVLETIKLFGASRCMFASNYPVDKVEMSPAPLYRQFTEFVEGVEEEDRKHLFVGTAEKFYRF